MCNFVAEKSSRDRAPIPIFPFARPTKMSNDSNNHILKGVSWSAFERFSVQCVQFAVFVFMARVLTPTDYGLVGMLTLFIIVCQLIAEGGLSQAIIRKLDRREEDFSTAFYVNILIGICLYGILWLCAPLIASFYDEPRLVDILRCLALCIPIQSTLTVHRAILTASLDFKTQAKSTIVGALFSGAVGLGMAYSGYGVWAIVGLQLTNQLATGLTLWIVADWRPKLIFSRAAFRKLFGFGSKLLGSQVIQTIYQSLYVLCIGKVFSAFALGCYTNARQLGSITSENLTNIVQRAAYPMFVKYQRDHTRLHCVIRDYLRISMFFIAPLMLGIAALATPLTLALIGDQWIYTSRLLRILCFYFLLYPLNSINFMILEIEGRGSLYLKLQIVNILVGIVLLVATIRFGLSWVCVGLFASYAINFIINSHFAGTSIRLGFIKQFRAIFPIIFNSSVMAAIVFAMQYILHGEWLQVSLGALIGIVVYMGLSIIFLTPLCTQILNLLRGRS